jgi:hypothetical protein
MAVFTRIRVGITDHVGIRVGDGQIAVHSLLILAVVVDCVAISAEDDASVAVFGDFLVSVLQIVTDEKSNSSAILTDECQH